MISSPLRALAGALLALFLATHGPALAQTMPDALAPPGEAAAADPWGRETPRGASDGLVAAFASGDPAEVVPFLDLSDLPPERHRFVGRRLAGQLEGLLDRSGGLLPSYLISTAPEGQGGDGLAPDLDRFAVARLDGRSLDLTLRRAEVDGIPVWRVSPAALALAAAQPVSDRPTLYDRWAPEALRDRRLAGVPLAAWAAVGLTFLATLLVAAALVWGLWALVSRLIPRLRQGSPARLLRPLRLPLALVVGGALFQVTPALVGIPVVARAAVTPVVEIAAWIALAWTLWRLVHAAGEEGLRSMTRRARLGAVSVVAMARRFAKAVIVVVALILMATSLGLDLTGWLAALGIGGLAIALGAQKTIEHLVGGVSLIADQPIRVGDFCQVDGVMGTVEDIGLRSTRLRTLDRTLVTIPNGAISSTRIENYAGRDRFHWHVTLGLRYETDRGQMGAVLARIDRMLGIDSRIAEGHRVRFVGFGASSLDVEIFAYILAADYPASLAVREELNLALMGIVDECGTGFAFPSSTVYLARDKPAAAPAPRRVPAQSSQAA